MMRQSFVTDDWAPIVLTPAHAREIRHTERTPSNREETIALHHYLVFAAIALLVVVTPAAWVASGQWAVACIVAGLALFLVSMAAILAPDLDEEIEQK